MPLTDDERIAIIGESLFGMALGDIHRTLGCNHPDECIGEESELHDGQPLLGALVQCCALLEAAAHHYAPDLLEDGPAFRRFVAAYLPKYNADHLWQVLRCGLLHTLMPRDRKGKYTFRYVLVKNRRRYHLQEDLNDPKIVYFNIQSFISDVDQAICAFLKAIETKSSEERTKALKWQSTRGSLATWGAMLETEIFEKGSITNVVLCGPVSGHAGSDSEFSKTIYQIGTTSLNVSPNTLIKPNLSTWAKYDRSLSYSGRRIK